MTDNMHGRDYILKTIKKVEGNILYDTDIYKHYNLTDEEIKLIENTV